MKEIRMTVEEKQVIVLTPDSIQPEQALWLIPPEGEEAEIWLENTKAVQYAETAKAILVCAPWDERDAFYTETLWTALHGQFPALSHEPGSHRLLGLGDSAERCLKFVFRYSERFCIAVAVCPTSHDEGEELLALVKNYVKSGKSRPRTVISDCAQGEGKRLGEAVNKHGVDMHVHAQRPVSGWTLMDKEIESCLAHL